MSNRSLMIATLSVAIGYLGDHCTQCSESARLCRKMCNILSEAERSGDPDNEIEIESPLTIKQTYDALLARASRLTGKKIEEFEREAKTQPFDLEGD